MSENITNILHTVTQILSIPCRVGLLLLMLISLIEIGRALAAWKSERSRKKVDYLGLIHDIHGQSREKVAEIIQSSDLNKRQKNELIELNSMEGYSKEEMTAAAEKMLSVEENLHSKSLRCCRLVSRLGPILGLMGTLIPLGPGITALGVGDTQTLSSAMTMAFDTTVSGLFSATIGFIILGIRNSWCQDDLTSIESLMECIIGEERDAEK